MKHSIFTVLFSLFLISGFVFAQENEESNEQPDAAPAQALAPAEMPSTIDGQISLLNIGTEGWRVVDVQGAGVYVASGGKTIHLEVGKRYRFDMSMVNSERYPLDMRASGGAILMTQDDQPHVVPPSNTDAEISEDGITFTFSETMANRITSFRSTAYPQMVGFITPIRTEEADETAEAIDDSE